MDTDLQNNQQLQRFIELLANLNGQIVELLKTGNSEILVQMNDTVEEMHAIQSKGEEDAYTAIEEEMQVICKNFNAVVMLVQSEEDGQDEQSSLAVRKFLHNMFDATVSIIYAYGLA